MRSPLLALLLCVAPLVSANEAALARFQQLMNDPILRQQAYDSGFERVRFCGYCHGEDGNSKRDYIPNLAGQNPIYLFKAFDTFANGQRNDFVMSKLAKQLTVDEQVDIAVYFSQQQVKPSASSVDAQLRMQGERVFQGTCIACHGMRAEGKEDAPRLAGQPGEYVRRALTSFHDGDPRRASSVMMPIAKQLTPADIEALAAYLEKLVL
ncbi:MULTISPECIES: c-type cytochrome [Pseudomonas]|uniref:Cytochrome biogenesis protein ResB n=1 Tax=Pseudomonas flexibilis TaxID=706570 RepID=A0A0B2DCU8_9PSED|nr:MULTISPECIES: c-type cytochrome [Pseudomonas]KHL70842.1 cytochrome biogenesis protein ResB [Pseudomonas flexibilis]KHO64439.1 cytochrome biogenesis protein ResB [Pseudomonas flexibilis]SCY05743.1 Cytochrome c553 [Pseudomonas flexibilis]SIP87647.1 Cytochrome c553 [Pseudomonas flexibilis]